MNSEKLLNSFEKKRDKLTDNLLDNCFLPIC